MLAALDPAYDAAAWDSFATAEVGAAAALAGLLVVSASINIARIITIPAIVSRLGSTLLLFGILLGVGTFLLVPGQDRWVLGTEIALVGLFAGGVVIKTTSLRDVEPGYRRNVLIVLVMGLVAAGIFTLAGVFCAFGVLGGLYWVVPGTILTFFVGLVNSWVALIEILR